MSPVDAGLDADGGSPIICEIGAAHRTPHMPPSITKQRGPKHRTPNLEFHTPIHRISHHGQVHCVIIHNGSTAAAAAVESLL